MLNGTATNTINTVTITNNQANDGTAGTDPVTELGGVGAIRISGNSDTNLIENNTITGNSATGSSHGSTVSMQNGALNNSLTSNAISNNQVTVGVPGVLVYGGSNNNLISLNTITNNSADSASTKAIISVEEGSILNSILTNTIYGNNPPVMPIVIALTPTSNHDQQAPIIHSAMACPCGPNGSWRLIISVTNPPAASDGNEAILSQIYFNSNTDPELNKYIGFFEGLPSTTFTGVQFPVSYADLVTYNRIVSTATNSNSDHPFGTTPPPQWGDTSPLSNEMMFIVS